MTFPLAIDLSSITSQTFVVGVVVVAGVYALVALGLQPSKLRPRHDAGLAGVNGSGVDVEGAVHPVPGEDVPHA